MQRENFARDCAAKDFFAQNCSRKQKPYGRTAANCEKLGFGINCRLFEKKRPDKSYRAFFFVHLFRAKFYLTLLSNYDSLGDIQNELFIFIN